MSQLQAHHFTHNAVCHFYAVDENKHIEYQLTDIAQKKNATVYGDVSDRTILL